MQEFEEALEWCTFVIVGPWEPKVWADTSYNLLLRRISLHHATHSYLWHLLNIYSSSEPGWNSQNFLVAIQIICDTFPPHSVTLARTPFPPMWHDNFHFTENIAFQRLFWWNLVQKWTKKWHVTFWLTPLPHVAFCDTVAIPPWNVTYYFNGPLRHICKIKFPNFEMVLCSSYS